MKRIILPFLAFIFLASTSPAQSGLFIDTSYTAEQMVMDFFANSCGTPTNITFTGTDVTMAFFEGANTNLGVNAGIVISSGDVTKIPNSADVFMSDNIGIDGDDDLTDLSGAGVSQDASVLEFDLEVAEDGNLDFNYVFGSEEYPEYVGSNFNDVFGFLITAPGANTPTNIALIPGADIPVTINNVNDGLNAQYYVDNQSIGDPDIVFDGMTIPLLASFMASGATTYHVKIGVSDVGDHIFDSGVFIGIESLCGDSLLAPPADALATVNGNTVNFENMSRYATSWHWDFGDNTTSDERYPAPHTYSQDGLYTVTLTTNNWCCEDVYTFTVQIGEVDAAFEADQNPFTLTPNPASDMVQLSMPIESAMEYQIFDLVGRAVMSGSVSGNTRLDVSHLNAGTYLFMVRNGEGVFTEKLIVE